MKKAGQTALIIAIIGFFVQAPTVTLADDTYVSTSIEVTEEIIGTAKETMLGINDVWNNGIAMSSNASTAVSEKYTDAIKNSDMPVFFSRMAGSESQVFRWKEALGKFDERGFYSNSGNKINMGLIEWLGYSREISPECRFAFCLNMLEESASDHADLVRFLCLEPSDPKAIGSDGLTNWAQKRVDLGFVEPIMPEVFELGNELDYEFYTNGTFGEKTNTDTTAVIQKADWYINLCNESISAMRALLPNLKFSAIAFTASGDETGTSAWRKAWNQRIISALGPKVDYIDVHQYYSKNSGFDLKTKKINADIQNYIDALSGGTKPKIYISEHALWHGETQENRHRTTSLFGALQISRVICQMNNLGNVDKMTYHAMNAGTDTEEEWTNGWAAVRKFTDGNFYVTGAGEALKTLAPAFDGGNTIKTEVSAEHSYYEKTLFGLLDSASADGILITTATKKPDNSMMNIVLVNTNETVGHNITFTGTNGYKLYKTYVLTADAVTADNNPSTPNGLYMKANYINSEASFTSYTIAPKTVTVLQLVPIDSVHGDENLQFSVNDKAVSNSAANATGRFSVTVRGYDNKSTANMKRVSLIVYPEDGSAGDMVYLATKESARELSKFYVEMPETAKNGNYIVSACTELGESNRFILTYTGMNTKNDISFISMSGGNIEINEYLAQADIYFTDEFAVGDSYNLKVLSESGTCVYVAHAKKTADIPNTVAITMPYDAVKGQYKVFAETSTGDSAYTSFNFNKLNETVSVTDVVKNQNNEKITIENMAETSMLYANVINRDAREKAIKVFLAAYDSTGRLLYISFSEEQTISDSESKIIGVPVSFNTRANCIKLFVWSLDSVTPHSYTYYIK